eukprot:6925998-Karenia_brevis.AAC.1
MLMGSGRSEIQQLKPERQLWRALAEVTGKGHQHYSTVEIATERSGGKSSDIIQIEFVYEEKIQ